MHCTVPSGHTLYSFTNRNKLTILSFNNCYEHYWSSNDNYQNIFFKHTHTHIPVSTTQALLILWHSPPRQSYSHTHTHTHTLIYHEQTLTSGKHTPSCLIPLHNKSRTHKKKASCGTSPRGVAHKIHLPQKLHKLMKSRPALSLLVMLAWLHVNRLTRLPRIFSPLTTPYHAYRHAHHIYRHTKPNNQGNNNTDNKT